MKRVSFQPSITDISSADRCKEQVTDTLCNAFTFTLAALLSGASSKETSGPSRKQISKACAGTIATVPQKLASAVASAETKYGIHFNTKTDAKGRISYTMDKSLTDRITELRAQINQHKAANLQETSAGVYSQKNVGAYAAAKSAYDTAVNAHKNAGTAKTLLDGDKPAGVVVSGYTVTFDEPTWYNSVGGDNHFKIYLSKDQLKDTVNLKANIQATSAYQNEKALAMAKVKQYEDAAKTLQDFESSYGDYNVNIGSIDRISGASNSLKSDMEAAGKLKSNDSGSGGMDCKTYQTTLDSYQKELARLNALSEEYAADMDEISAMQEQLTYAYEHSDAESSYQEASNAARNTRRKGGKLFGWLFKGKPTKGGGTYDKKVHKQAVDNKKLSKDILRGMDDALRKNWEN